MEILIAILLFLIPLHADAQEQTARTGSPLPPDSVPSVLVRPAGDTAVRADTAVPVRRRRGFFRSIGHGLRELIREFDRKDTNYIQPQAYNYAFMIQNTNTFEGYRFATKDKNISITLAPDGSWKLGPYFGWRWIFLGYTLDVKHAFSHNRGTTSRKEFSFSLYSSMVGIDFFWRDMGNGYRIHNIRVDGHPEFDDLKGTLYDGFSSSLRGANFYYIFNHRRFSYPAAYSQSTVQRRSAGSAIAGIGVTRHKMNLDFQDIIDAVRTTENSEELDKLMEGKQSNIRFNYLDVSASGGYSYNWVFARNCLLNSSLTMGLGYKSAQSKVDGNSRYFQHFDFRDFNVDGIGRFALVYNNMKWYAGASAIIHAYTYRKDQIRSTQVNATYNIYVGFNFGRRK